MKLGFRSCLRCFEPLARPDAATPNVPAQRGHLSRRATLAVAAGASIVVMSLTGVVWRTTPDPVREVKAAGTAPVSAIQAQVETPGGDAESASRPAYEPATFLDSARAGGASFAGADFESARAAYEQALLKRPDDPDTLNNLGQVLVRLGRVDEGIARFEQALQVAPDAWAPHFNLAAAEGERGRWDRAIEQYREAVRVFPDDYATQFNLALALHRKGDEPAAIAEYEKAIVLAPSEPGFHTALGLSLEKTGRTADALREYHTFLAMDPSSSDAEKVKAHVDALAQVLPTAR
jgi:Flp pilus assembly protein TadD